MAKSENGAHDVMSVLQSMPIWSNAKATTADALISAGRLVELKRNQTFCRRGDPGESMALVVSGRVKVANFSASGKEVVLGFVGPGGVIGEFAVFDDAARAADVIATEPSTIFILRRDDVLPAIKTDPELLLKIIALLCGKLREASAVVEEGSLEMLSRASAGLLRLMKLHGKQLEYGTQIDMVVTQRDLGGYFGMTRENANRQISYLRDEGYITIEDAKIIIIDRDGLQDLADSS